MIGLDLSIAQIELLLKEDTEASITYAALECRLAIERICYERLRLAHDYISHEDLKKWQPRDVVNTLIQEVDSNVAETFTLSISREPLPNGMLSPALEDYQALEFVPVGIQVGFDPNKLGRLWNGLANLALHVTVPVKKDHQINQYGDTAKIRAKVEEAIVEIKRIGRGTLGCSGIGPEISFNCVCGTTNKRRISLLRDGQQVGCINRECSESYEYFKKDQSFGRRVFEIACRACDTKSDIPKRKIERLRNDQSIQFSCEGCDETIHICWRPMQGQKTKPKDSSQL